MSLRKIVKYFRPVKTHDVSELAENAEITDEIEKTLWELRTLGFTEKEIRESIRSLKKENQFKN